MWVTLQFHPDWPFHDDLVAMADASRRDYLDDYVEAHVHGGLELDRDVERIVPTGTPGFGPAPPTWTPRTAGRSTSTSPVLSARS